MDNRLKHGRLHGDPAITVRRGDHHRVVVAITGGSGAGKTTIADAVKNHYGDECGILPVDAYYKHYDFLTAEQRDDLDWETIDTIDIALLTGHLQTLGSGQPVEMPEFDFSVRLRSSSTQVVAAPQVLVLEGLFALAIDQVVKAADIRVFVEASEKLRYQRRYDRDVATRGRSPESVATQWVKSVQPGHLTVVEPQRAHANLVIDGSMDATDAVRLISDRVETLLRVSSVGGSP